MEAAEPLEAEGELRTAPLDRAALVARSGERADLRALSAQLDQAEAERRLASREAWPDVGLGARYERDEGDDIALGEVSVPIPLFDREQARRAEANARARRLRLELDAARRAARVEIETALAVHGQRLAAAQEIEASALPLLDENEALARRSYEAGEMGLAELLIVRRETLDTRREYLDRLRDAAVARIDALAAAGGIE
jgi:cobalt-zinc-cadmium efflux system outer membrane protein